MGKSKTIEQQANQDAAIRAYLDDINKQLQADVDAAAKELDTAKEKYFKDGGITDAKPFLQGKNSDIQLISEWSLANIQTMINKVKDVVFEKQGSLPGAGIVKDASVVSSMQSVTALADMNVFLASKAFDAIASILSAFTTGNDTSVQKNNKTEMVAPGIIMFMVILEKAHRSKDFFNNETHAENIFIYEFWFSLQQGQAVSQFNDLAAYEDLKQAFRTRISALGKKVADPSVDFEDIKKLQDQIDYYGKQLTDLTNKQTELEHKKNETVKAEAFRIVQVTKDNAFRKYTKYEKERRRSEVPLPTPPKEPTETTKVYRSIAELSFLQQESICGQDTRLQVTTTTGNPYYAICSLLITMEGGEQYLGSGWLASFSGLIADQDWKNHVVMTSGHCVFAGGEFPKAITIIPGRNLTENPYGEVTIVSTDALRVAEEWKNHSDSDYDYGAILIPREAKAWGAMSWVDLPDEDLKNQVIINTGYPGDKLLGSLWTAKGPITQVTTHKLKYMNSTEGGQSGSPAYLAEDQLRVVGIHGYGGCPNKAVRLTENVTQNMKRWAQEKMS